MGLRRTDSPGARRFFQYIKDMDFSSLSVQQFRMTLEASAEESSYMECSEETLTISESIIHPTEGAKTFEDYEGLNNQFHQMLFRDAQVPLLLDLISDLCNRVNPYVILHYSSMGVHYNGSSSLLHEYHRGMQEGMRRKDIGEVLKNLKTDLSKKIGRGLWFLCLVTGTALLVAGHGIRVLFKKSHLHFQFFRHPVVIWVKEGD